MATIVQSVDENTIALPARLMELLQVQEGDEIKTTVSGNTLQLTPLEKFLALRGVWEGDSGVDEAIEILEQAWTQWTPPASV